MEKNTMAKNQKVVAFNNWATAAAAVAAIAAKEELKKKNDKKPFELNNTPLHSSSAHIQYKKLHLLCNQKQYSHRTFGGDVQRNNPLAFVQSIEEQFLKQKTAFSYPIHYFHTYVYKKSSVQRSEKNKKKNSPNKKSYCCWRWKVIKLKVISANWQYMKVSRHCSL